MVEVGSVAAARVPLRICAMLVVVPAWKGVVRSSKEWWMCRAWDGSRKKGGFRWKCEQSLLQSEHLNEASGCP